MRYGWCEDYFLRSVIGWGVSGRVGKHEWLVGDVVCRDLAKEVKMVKAQLEEVMVVGVYVCVAFDVVECIVAL